MKALLVLVALTTIARADATAELDLRLDLGAHAAKIAELRSRLARALDGHTAETCATALAHAREAGVTGGFEIESSAFANLPTARHTGTSWSLTLDHARIVCDELRKWRGLAVAQKALLEAQGLLDWLKLIDRSTNFADNAAKLEAGARACAASVAQLTGDGVPTDVPVEVGDVALTLGDAPAQICEPLAAAAKTFGKDVTAARDARTKTVAAPYRAVGITGDRLQLLIDHAGDAMYAVGGGELTTPRALKAARVIFEESSDGDIWTVARFEFRGDKLVKTTRKQYLMKPAEGAFR